MLTFCKSNIADDYDNIELVEALTPIHSIDRTDECKPIVERKHKHHHNPLVEKMCCVKCGRKIVVDEQGVCPHCGHRYEDEYEPLDIIQDDYLTQDEQSILLQSVSEHKSKACNTVCSTTARDNKSDNRKGQTSLALGSYEYIEYTKDLKEHDPFKPDDLEHKEWEEHNEDLSTKGYEDDNKNATDIAIEKFITNEISKRQLKLARHGLAVRLAKRDAFFTPTKVDDIKASKITSRNSAIYDPGVSVSGYIKAVSDLCK